MDLTQEEKDRLKSFETLADEIVDRMMGEKPEERRRGNDRISSHCNESVRRRRGMYRNNQLLRTRQI